MAEERRRGTTRSRRDPPAWIPGGLWTIFTVSLLLVPLIFILPIETFRMIGNALEILSALFCMLCCLYLYRFAEDRVIFSLSAFAFFGYALSNLFWYLYSVTFGRAVVYVSVAELGFFCFYLFLIAAITIEFPEREVPPLLSSALILLLVVIPILVTALVCADQPLRIALTAILFLLIEQLIEASLRHGVFRYPLLAAGIVLSCTGDFLYAARETVVLQYAGTVLSGPVPGGMPSLYNLLSIVGPVTVCSFTLIVIGLISMLRTGNDTVPRSPSEG